MTAVGDARKRRIERALIDSEIWMGYGPDPSADRHPAEFRAEIARTIWHTSRNDEGTISATGANIIADALLAGPVCDLWAERDALRAQVAAVAKFADAFKHQWNQKSMTPTTFDRGVGAMAQDVLALLDDPDQALRNRDAEKWDEGYGKGNLDGYFGTSDEKNPYRIEKGEMA